MCVRETGAKSGCDAAKRERENRSRTGWQQQAFGQESGERNTSRQQQQQEQWLIGGRKVETGVYCLRHKRIAAAVIFLRGAQKARKVCYKLTIIVQRMLFKSFRLE
ncbi:unnamed protein product [Calypogeia fissa]